jgi:DNA mismatch repair ATPase MutS
MALQPLRHVDTECAGLLFGTQGAPALPPWVRHLWLVPLGFAAAAGLFIAGHAAAGTAVLLVALLASARVQIVLHPALLQWQAQRRALLALARGALAVGQAAAAQGAAAHPLLQGVLATRDTAAALQRAVGPRWSDRMPVVAEYANLLALAQYRRCAQQLAALQALRKACQPLYCAVAGLEADLAVQAHLQFAQGTCAADLAPGRNLAFVGLSHPLLHPAHPLDVALHGQGAFITGQNGAGKSTLLRSVGLNVVVGQALGLCYAQQAQVPGLPVVSSLQVEDSLGTATSLYMAELQRARELCAAAQAPGGALCLVDEIFRGTNPQESVAATAALAHALAAGGLVLLATHHRVLAPMLAVDLRAVCVERGADGLQRLRDGVLERTNGLAMLADYGFSPATQAVAATVFDWLQAQAAGGLPDAAAPALPRAAPPWPAA